MSMIFRALLGGALAVGWLAVGSGCGDDTTSGAGGGSTSATGGDGGTGGGDGGAAPEYPPLLGADCDPMVPTHCGLPFPSNVYLVDDPTGKNPSGKSVRFGKTTLPAAKKTGISIEPSAFYDHDGFSPATAIMTHLPLAVADDCATPYDIERSLLDDSPTVLIEADTGRRVPHWVDLDMSTDHDGLEGRPDERLFMIRPAERLKDGTRYVVAVRHVIDHDGQEIAPTPVFAALRAGEVLSDGTEVEKLTTEARKPLYVDIFSRLADAGVDKADLQAAWDFTTATKENNTAPMLSVRDQALADVGAQGPTYVVENVEEFPTPADNPNLLRRFELKMTLPLYLTSAATSFPPNVPMATLNRDADGHIVKNGTMELSALVLVPRSVESGEKHGLLQNGHGLFGSRNEGRNGFLATAANQDHYIAFSVNLFGFDEDAEAVAGQILAGRPDSLVPFTERQIQGMVNQLLAMRMMMGRVASDGIVDGDGNMLLDPAWIDPAVRAYRGDSQGGIMGATYMSISTDVTRGLLGEPGTPYALLLNRSVDWSEYEAILKIGYGDDAINLQLFLNTIQMAWDRAEPSGFAPYMQKDMLPDTPAHHVILHVARGDHQVSNFGAYLLAREIGAKVLLSNDPNQPFFDDVYGVDTMSAPSTNESAVVQFDFGLPPIPATNLAADAGCDPHDRLRLLDPAFDQQDVFFRTGAITWTCDGACNCDDTLADATEEAGCRASYTDQCE